MFFTCRKLLGHLVVLYTGLQLVLYIKKKKNGVNKNNIICDTNCNSAGIFPQNAKRCNDIPKISFD